MDGQLVHFELPAEDAGRAKEFWKSLFGWKFREWSGPVEYHMLEGIEPGGAIYPSEEQAGQGPIVYFDTLAARPTRSSRFRRSAGSLAAATPKGTSSHSSRLTSWCPLQAKARRR
jgi:predicted enzyme related to lactoylglutathione lyase